jgi:catechol 2,3-dioxygenase-like lactoylglutathione lyase family enzyme
MVEYANFHHVSFASKNLAASRAFFGEVLGLQEINRPAFTFPGAWYALGDRQLHIIENQDGGGTTPARQSRSDHVALEVPDIAAVKNALQSHGIAFEEGTNQQLGMAQVFCRDPDGHVIEFIQFLHKG